jgi:hypothetical protein
MVSVAINAGMLWDEGGGGGWWWLVVVVVVDIGWLVWRTN